MRSTRTLRSTRTVRPTRPVRITVALAAAVLAAPVALATTPAQGLVGNPVTLDDSYSFTAQLRIGTGEQIRTCSGALIAPQWIATAASCFAANPSQGGPVEAGAPTLRTVATIGRADLSATSGGHVSEVTELVPRAGRDLVLARLATPAAGIRPVPLASTPPVAGETLTVAGYGRTRTEWVPDRLHAASFDVNTVDPTTLGITGRTADDAICKGDSGGPVLRERDGVEELVGVSSRSWQGGCLGVNETRNGAVVARTDDAPTGTRLAAGQRLRSGDTLASATTTLTMRADGDLVVTSKAGKVRWSTKTGGNAGATAHFGADGNLVVRDSSDTTTLWQSGTSAPGGTAVLQERGNVVVYDAQGTSRWTTGTAVRNDVDGDGRADMVNWYDYPDGHDALFRFPGTDSGAFTTPHTAWTTAPGNWSIDQARKVSGDFDGDGRSDVAVLYGYLDGSVKLWTFLGRPDGTFTAPFPSWSTTPGNWEFSRVRLQAGDFDGNGRDDLAAWYDYADGSDALFTFTSDAQGAFAPVQRWSSAPGNWSTAQSKYVTGDFNGDGRDDVGVLYTYGGNAVKFWTFLANPSGGFDGAKLAWDHPTWGSWDRTDPHAGDFDGDGLDDVALWYDYPDGRDSVYVFKGNKDGTVTGSPNAALTSPAGWLMRDQMKIVVADYTGDGRDDLATMYGYTDGTVRMFTWPGQADGTLGAGQTGWSTGSGWEFGRVHFVNRHHQS